MPQLPSVKRFVCQGGARVYRIPCHAFPGLTGRVYLVLDAGPPTLVDTGTGEPESLRHVLDGFDTVRSEFGEPVRLADVGRIVITHAHVDHFGGLAHLKERTGAEVAVHALDSRLIAAYEERAVLTNHALERFLKQAGVAPARRTEVIAAFGYTPRRLRSVAVDRVVEDGDALDGLRVIHTPGHSPGHVCLRIDDVLLAGDHILARTASQQWPESIAPYTGLGHYLESLEKIRAIEGIELVLGGHEPPVRELPGRIEEIRHTHLRRLDRVQDILRRAGRPLTIEEIADRMYSNQHGFHAMLALTDVGSRVEYLDQRGRLAVANLDEAEAGATPAWRYRLA